MVESLSELNRLCQKPRYREVGNWMVRKILRPAALPITWLLLHTQVTANQVTLAALLIGILGSLLLAFKGSAFFLSGVFLLQFWYLLDHVDGQIARYRKTASLSGRFFDFLMHHLIHASVFAGLAWFAYAHTAHLFWLFAGYPAVFAIFLFNLTHDLKCKTFVEKLISPEAGALSEPCQESSVSSSVPKNSGWGRKLISFLTKLIEMHVMMNALTALALTQIFFPAGDSLRFYFFIIYAPLVATMTALRSAHWIKAQQIDTEFRRLFPGSGASLNGENNEKF